MHKSRTTAILMAMLMWEGGDFCGLLDKELQSINDCWENWPLPEIHSLIGYSMQSGQPWKHIHTNNRNRLSRLYLYTFVHIHTYGPLIIKAKEVY